MTLFNFFDICTIELKIAISLVSFIFNANFVVNFFKINWQVRMGGCKLDQGRRNEYDGFKLDIPVSMDYYAGRAGPHIWRRRRVKG